MTIDARRMYCDKCRPEKIFVKPQYLVRYMNAFKAHVRHLIAENSGFGDIVKDAEIQEFLERTKQNNI